MEINLKTKFNVGDIVLRNDFMGFAAIKILGIEIHVNEEGKIESFYKFKPHSDSHQIHAIRTDQVFEAE